MKSLSLGGVLFSTGLILSVFWGYDFLIFIKGFIVFFLLFVGLILIYFGIEDFSFSIKENRLEESSSENIQQDIKKQNKDVKEKDETQSIENKDVKEEDETKIVESKDVTEEDEILKKNKD